MIARLFGSKLACMHILVAGAPLVTIVLGLFYLQRSSITARCLVLMGSPRAQQLNGKTFISGLGVE